MKKKNIILIIMIILLVLLMLGAGLFLVLSNIQNGETKDEYDQLASSYASGTTETEPVTEIVAPDIDEKKVENPIDFAGLIYQNVDIYSWIYVPDTNISYPVVQSGMDDNFYLSRDVYGNYKYAGTIYSQSCNAKNYMDRVTVLYGHNMADGSMFADIHKFADKSFFDKHEYFYVYTPDRKLTYRVVSVHTYDDRHIMNSFDFKKDDVYQSYLDMIQNPRAVSQNVREGIELDLDSKVLTLSTCTNSGNGRFLLQGVLVKDEPTI